MRDTNLLLTDLLLAASAFSASALSLDGTPPEGVWLEFLITRGNYANPTIAIVETVKGAALPTNEVQTLTIAGVPTGGTFKLTYDGQTTASITWTAVDATLVAAIDAALEALSNIAPGEVTVADTTLTGGIGDVTITFSGGLAATDVPLITVAENLLTDIDITVSLDITLYGKDTDAAWALDATVTPLVSLKQIVHADLAELGSIVRYMLVQTKLNYVKPYYTIAGVTPVWSIVCSVVSGPDQKQTAAGTA